MMTGSTKKTALELFQQGVAQAKAGHKTAARQIIRQVISMNPDNEAAWLYLVGISDHRQDAIELLRRVEQLNPANPHLERARAWIAQTWPGAAQASTEQPNEIKRGLLRLKNTFGVTALSLKRLVFRGKTEAGKQGGSLIFAGKLRKKPSKAVAGALAAGLVVVILMIVALGTPTGAAANFIGNIVTAPTQAVAQTLTLPNNQVESLQYEADRPATIVAVEEMHALLSDDSEITAQLADRYFDQGLMLRDGNNFEAAQDAFEKALQIRPDFEAAGKERDLIDLYLAGTERRQEAKWGEAAAVFKELYRQDPTYPFAAEMLFSSLYNLGAALQSQGKLGDAIQTFEQAGQIMPYTPEVEQRIIELTKLLAPPSPKSPPRLLKRVVVDISEQRAYTYEGDTLVYQFIISTGEPGRDTAAGQFEILNKMPMAYASTWNLDMPYWLGVYWAGGLQNGFHALPTVRHTGYTLWDGFLGQRVSYGCIILSYADAQTLYDWVDIGTPVTIQY